MAQIETLLLADPQRKQEKFCPACGGCVYPPDYHCVRCERRQA